jgi:hypothetical protein
MAPLPHTRDNEAAKVRAIPLHVMVIHVPAYLCSWQTRIGGLRLWRMHAVPESPLALLPTQCGITFC